MAMPQTSDSPLWDADQRSLDALIDLHTRSIDTLQGFDKMVEKSVPAFRPTAERFRTLHEWHVEKLDVMIRERGAIPDEHGSFMATVNRAVVTLRATFDDINTEVMNQIRNGEDHLLAAFDRAVAAPLSHPDLETVIRMRTELVSLLDDTRHLE